MTTLRATRPKVTSADRLSLTVVLALILHGLIILGISFGGEDLFKPPQKLPGLEVTLVQSRSDEKIEDADFLAQANQEGGGNTTERARPTSPVTPVVASGEAGEVREVVPQTQLPSSRRPQGKEVLTAAISERRSDSQATTPQAEEEQVTAAQLMSRSMEIARLSAEIDQSRKVYAQQPRKKYISSRTKEYRFASYEEAWRAKVERIGNLNFPDEAKRKKLSGSLRLAVTINADGTVKEIKIRKSSGHRILDDAAMRIVRLAAPYARFPEDIRKDYDELVITRTWQFDAGNHLSTR